MPGCHASSGLLTLNVNAWNVCHRIECKPVRILMEHWISTEYRDSVTPEVHSALSNGRRIQTEHLDFDRVTQFSRGGSHASTQIEQRAQTEHVDVDVAVHVPMKHLCDRLFRRHWEVGRGS
jgi:hypothetical protein